jgi:hypothetical protein
MTMKSATTAEEMYTDVSVDFDQRRRHHQRRGDGVAPQDEPQHPALVPRRAHQVVAHHAARHDADPTEHAPDLGDLHARVPRGHVVHAYEEHREERHDAQSDANLDHHADGEVDERRLPTEVRRALDDPVPHVAPEAPVR